MCRGKFRPSAKGSWGATYPIGVKYRFPQDLPKHWTVFCDIHSHCEMGAYASQTDIDDEDNFTGLHIVVGRLHQEPPEFHVEGVVDGTRFPVEWDDVVAGYQHRRVFPAEWLDQVDRHQLREPSAILISTPTVANAATAASSQRQTEDPRNDYRGALTRRVNGGPCNGNNHADNELAGRGPGTVSYPGLLMS